MYNKQVEIHKDIIESSKQSNPKAQYQLYRLYSKAMLNICNRMMNSLPEAEDMLQDSFGEAFSKLSTFKYESTFGAWLKRITINRCINELKRKKTDIVSLENIAEIDRKDDEEYDDSNIKYEVNNIMKAFEMLPAGYRVIFSLYMFEGYDHGEISQIMNISESTSKTQYLRAKKKIKEIIKTQVS